MKADRIGTTIRLNLSPEEYESLLSTILPREQDFLSSHRNSLQLTNGIPTIVAVRTEKESEWTPTRS